MQSKLKGNLILALTALIWGLSFISQTTSMDHIEPSTFNGIRMLIGSAVLLPFIFFSNKKQDGGKENVKSDKKSLILGGVVCGVILCAASTLQTYSMVGISGGKAAFITATYIIFVPIISIFFKKRPSLRIIPAIIIAITGFYFLCIKNGESLTLGYFETVALICAVLFSFHIIAVDFFSPRVEGIKLSCIQFFVCAVINIFCMFAFEHPDINEILKCWFPILFAGAFSCGLAYTLQIYGQKYTDPSSATFIMSLESVFAAIFCWLLPPYVPEDVMSLREILGCILIFGAITLIQLPERKK